MENLCRLCLRSPEKLEEITNFTGLTDKIEAISQIELSDNPNLPSTICQECVSNVNKLYNFRKVIINSDKEIRERYISLQHRPKNRSKIQQETEEEIKQENDNYVESAEETCLEDDKDETNDTLMKVLATMREFPCKICDKIFPSRIKLYNHRRTNHISRGVCNICGLTIRQDNLSRHVQMHSEGPAECNKCGKIFKNSESLRGHLLYHKGDIFTCEICGKTSRVKTEHTRHMKAHEDPEIRKVMCSICGKKVRDLKKHMHSHTGERPYLCSFCNKGFTSPYALKIHTRQHTNEKPYNCNFCPMAFPQKISLTTHLKSKHNIQFND